MKIERVMPGLAAALVAGQALAHPGHGESVLVHPHVGLDQLAAVSWWAALLLASGGALDLLARRLARVRRARAASAGRPRSR